MLLYNLQTAQVNNWNRNLQSNSKIKNQKRKLFCLKLPKEKILSSRLSRPSSFKPSSRRKFLKKSRLRDLGFEAFFKRLARRLMITSKKYRPISQTRISERSWKSC